MTTTNRVETLVEKRASKTAQTTRMAFVNRIMADTGGLSRSQTVDKITTKLKELGYDGFTDEHVNTVLEGLFSVVYDKEYDNSIDSNMQNIADMLSFMEREL